VLAEHYGRERGVAVEVATNVAAGCTRMLRSPMRRGGYEIANICGAPSTAQAGSYSYAILDFHFLSYFGSVL
jgi:hypothetical protein